MKIEINTKFSINDIVYGFYNGLIWKFKVKNIHVDYNYNKRSFMYDTDCIKYDVIEVPDEKDKNSECGCPVMNTSFYERELHTLDELNFMFKELNEKKDAF